MSQQDVAIIRKLFSVTKDLSQIFLQHEAEKHAVETPWDNDPINPRNWPTNRKWIMTTLMSTFLFFTLLASTVAAPTLPFITRDLKIESDVQTQIVLSVYVLSYAMGSLLFAPLSETYGRLPVLHSTNILFLAFNTVCGFTKSERLMIVGRLLAGLGGSGALALNSGLLGDCWRREERGRSIAIYSFIPLLGPAIGPVAGGFIARYTIWRWAFWSTSIVQATMQIPALVLLRETHHPTLIHRARKHVQNQNPPVTKSAANADFQQRSSLSHSLLRPVRLLTTQPIIIVLSLYIISQYGVLWLMFSSVYSLFTTQYHLPIHLASLPYLSVGLGFFLGTRITSLFTDRIYAQYKLKLQRSNPTGQHTVPPEVRLLLTFPASLLPPLGLLIYGWTAAFHLHPAIPNIGIALVAMGFTTGNQCIAAYIVDVYPHYTASAMTAANAVRYVAGFGFPLFAPGLYKKLGYGWGNTLLAGCVFGMGVPGMVGVWKWGGWLRGRSQFAAGEREGNGEGDGQGQGGREVEMELELEEDRLQDHRLRGEKSTTPLPCSTLSCFQSGQVKPS